MSEGNALARIRIRWREFSAREEQIIINQGSAMNRGVFILVTKVQKSYF
jgi:hypothetical protein